MLGQFTATNTVVLKERGELEDWCPQNLRLGTWLGTSMIKQEDMKPVEWKAAGEWQLHTSFRVSLITISAVPIWQQACTQILSCPFKQSISYPNPTIISIPQAITTGLLVAVPNVLIPGLTFPTKRNFCSWGILHKEHTHPISIVVGLCILHRVTLSKILFHSTQLILKIQIQMMIKVGY